MGRALAIVMAMLVGLLLPVSASAHIPTAEVERTGYTLSYSPVTDGTGFTNAQFSFRVSARWDFTLRYENFYTPDGAGTFTADFVMGGARYHLPAPSRADLYVAAEIGTMTWTDSFTSNVSATVYTASLGGSYALTPKASVYGSIGSDWITDYTGTFSEAAYDIGLRLRATDQVSVVVGRSGAPDHWYGGISLSW